MFELNDLLKKCGVPESSTIVLRHRPTEPELRKLLPRLAAEEPRIFNAYQSAHNRQVEQAMLKLAGRGFLAACIGHEPERAVFVGLYCIRGARAVTASEFWKIPENQTLKRLGSTAAPESEIGRDRVQWFDLRPMKEASELSGRLVVSWPPPERSWWRRAERNVMPIVAISPGSLFNEEMPDWQELVLGWNELRLIPASWKQRLAQWRGIYCIFDKHRNKRYVGAAYGKNNILGRWTSYATTGHGGNKLLRESRPGNLYFSILQRVSPDATPDEVLAIEATWKVRLHTRAPHGLNDN